MNGLEITKVRVKPRLDGNSAIKADVHIELNGVLKLNGLRVIKGQFGHFLSYPQIQPGSPFKCFDVFGMRFREALQREVLKQYAIALADALPREVPA